MNYKTWTLMGLSVVLLAGCPFKRERHHISTDNKVPSNERTYQVVTQNNTADQNYSPVAMIVHNGDYQMFTFGNPASLALEHLAEGGANERILQEARTNRNVVIAMSSDAGVAPGMASEMMFNVNRNDMNSLALASMLIETNDGFIGENDIRFGHLQPGESMIVNTPVWDAGTELNTETRETIPGLGGVGFDPAREPSNFVTTHPGVISVDDGLTTSNLNYNHRFDNPGGRVVITRIK